MNDPNESIQAEITGFLAEISADADPEQRPVVSKWNTYAKTQLSQLRTDASMGRLSPAQYTQRLHELRNDVIGGAGADTLTPRQRAIAAAANMDPAEYARQLWKMTRR